MASVKAAKLQGRVAIATRYKSPDLPELRRQYKAARLAERLAEELHAGPRLTRRELAELAALITEADAA